MRLQTLAAFAVALLVGLATVTPATAQETPAQKRARRMQADAVRAKQLVAARPLAAITLRAATDSVAALDACCRTASGAKGAGCKTSQAEIKRLMMAAAYTSSHAEDSTASALMGMARMKAAAALAACRK